MPFLLTNVSTAPLHKRKRSSQESTADLSDIEMALRCLNSFKEELEGHDVQAMMERVTALEEILEGLKEPVRRSSLHLCG